MSTRQPPPRPGNMRGAPPTLPARGSDTSKRPQKEPNICMAFFVVLASFGICLLARHFIASNTPAAPSTTHSMPLELAHDEPKPSRQALCRVVRRLMASGRHVNHDSTGSTRPDPELFEFLGMHPIAPECHPGSPAGSTGRAAHDVCCEKILQAWFVRMNDLGVSSVSVDADRADDVGLVHAVTDALLDGQTRVDYIDNVLPVLRPAPPSRFSWSAKAGSGELNSVCPMTWIE